MVRPMVIFFTVAIGTRFVYSFTMEVEHSRNTMWAGFYYSEDTLWRHIHDLTQTQTFILQTANYCFIYSAQCFLAHKSVGGNDTILLR